MDRGPFYRMEQKRETHHHRALEAFAHHFIAFIREQTEESSKHAPPRCDTPKKAPTGSAFEPDPVTFQRKLSINDGSGSGGPTSGTPPAKGAGELDTSAAEENLIARKPFDPHGGPTGGRPTDDEDSKVPTGHSTPKRPESTVPNGVCSTPNGNHNQAVARCKTTDEVGFCTPPRSSNASRSMLLSFTSTPIAGKGSQGSSRNGSLEVSSQRHETSGFSEGRRSKAGSPCLGDFIVTQAMKGHKNRRSGGNDPGGLNSTGNANSGTLYSSMFQDNDFPQLNVTSPAAAVSGGEDGPAVKKRTSASTSQEAFGSGRRNQRRRIAPTTVSHVVSGRHDFTSSSLRSENNLISIGSLEEANHDPRRMLRSLKDEIRSDFQCEEQAQRQRTVRAKQSLHTTFDEAKKVGPPSTGATDDLGRPADAGEGTDVPKAVLVIEFDKVTEKPTIDRLVAVYALLMDLNLVPNVLNELAYLINLVSTERYVVQRPPDATALANVLRRPHNCVYFATEVLHRQRKLLALLDGTSLRVVVENEELSALHPPLNGFLRDMLAQKVKLENTAVVQTANQGDLLANSSITNVFYQQENDTKDHFPSSKEFNAFNKQRDSFYAILRTWEIEHLNPAWEFELKLGAKVRSMLDILHHPINMAHLAKLFSAQLIISFNFDNSASELQIALPNIDLTKLSKLRQRLVAPSIFSTQYLFPGSQIFFRDFIVASENHQIFIEQLKAVLVHELLQMNGSSFEIFNVCDSESASRPEYVVRPETIATMRVLAKFIGFIIARPFQYEGCRSTIVENRQIELRNMLLPPFDVKPVLLTAVADRKLVITVPWLVQYLSMLDVVTLRLRYYEELFRMLHDIYKATAACGPKSHRDLFVIPTSKFIVRSCLDWLFDQSNVPEDYYNSSDRSGNNSLMESALGRANAAASASWNAPDKPIVFNALLENVLSAACPFLADFRVSVMPSKVEKSVSRTGRYRHITTRYSGVVSQLQGTPGDEASATLDSSVNMSSASLSKSTHGNVQQRLVDAFLQSQSHSLRRTVALIIERTTSAVIKDFQMMFLLPEKKTVADRIAQARAETLDDMVRQIQGICDEALGHINNTWESNVPKMLNKRIKDALDALLPTETIDAVRMLCRNITLEKCLQKSNEWSQAYISDTELFCKNITSEAQSLLNKAHHREPCKTFSTNCNQTELIIADHCAVMPSGHFVQLQMLLHQAASSPGKVTNDELVLFLAKSLKLLDDSTLITTPMMNRMLGFMLLQLFLLLIKSRCDLCTPEHFQSAVTIWKHPRLSRFCSPPPPESDDSPSAPSSPSLERSFVYPAQIEQYRRKRMQRDANYIFSHLISNRYIRMLEKNAEPQPHYEIYATFISNLLDAGVVTKDLLNEQLVAIFNEEWPKPTLDRISTVINRVLQKSRPGHSIDDSHSEMFMEMLSDFARDITDL